MPLHAQLKSLFLYSKHLKTLLHASYRLETGVKRASLRGETGDNELSMVHLMYERSLMGAEEKLGKEKRCLHKLLRRNQVPPSTTGSQPFWQDWTNQIVALRSNSFAFILLL